jgi:hypothetical protein
MMKNPFQPIAGFEKSRKESLPLNELTEIRAAAPRVRDAFMATGMPQAVRQFSCSVSPYPTVYGFHTAYEGLHPFLWFNNRATLVQFEEQGKLKNLLFNPIFPDLSAEAPFYANLRRRIPQFMEGLLAKIHPPVAQQLQAFGLTTDDIDYLSYDHLHVQDLRPLMGVADAKGGWIHEPMFKNAKFIFPKAEWDVTNNLHPSVQEWYVPRGLEHVETKNLILYEGDIQLGPGVALIATPGHTAGNHSLYLNTSSGTMTMSENGVGADAYSPENSKINSVRNKAKDRGWEVVLNANTLDLRLLQYNSMIKEKLLSGPAQDSDFINHRPTSEFTTWLAAPGLRPSYEHGDLEHGSFRGK